MSSPRGKYQGVNTFDTDEITSGHASDAESSSSASTEDLHNRAAMTLENKRKTRRERNYDYVHKADNRMEAQKNLNNLMFGMKKWNGHVTQNPEEQSALLKELYADQEQISDLPTLRPGNVIYVILFGWWISLVYLIVALLMLLSILGRCHAPFCLKLAKYFIWPFGRFIKRDDPLAYDSMNITQNGGKKKEHVPLIGTRPIPVVNVGFGENYWKRKSTYIWCVLGVPLLYLVHALVFAASWLTVVFIPTAKLNSKIMKKVIFMPPELLSVDRSSFSSERPGCDIIAYTYQAVNVHYYKLNVDGINVCLVNMMFLVIITVILGYFDPDNNWCSMNAKFALSLISIMPLSYYIGMAITSISAQSSPAIGALLNASFGSGVELMLYTLALFKQADHESRCYTELVKSGFIGTVLATMVMIPGVCMILGGIKFESQKFNPRSVGVTSTLAFVAVACIFAPTIFAKIYGATVCTNCDYDMQTLHINGTEVVANLGYLCERCETTVFSQHGDSSTYDSLVRPLAYIMAIMLPLCYICGLIFSLKTHKKMVHDVFQEESEADTSHADAVAHWSTKKGCGILLVCTVLMALCADILTGNLEPILSDSGMSVYFIGITIMAVVPDIPEVVNGILFALHNDISLSIEVGTCMAVQVCMVQMPILIGINAIFDLHFYLLFDDIHLWSVLFSVFMMNYVLQNGKADYFQGVAVTIVYVTLITMYFFTPSRYEC